MALNSQPPYGREVEFGDTYTGYQVGAAVAIGHTWACAGASADGHSAGDVKRAGAVHCKLIDGPAISPVLLVAPDPTENAAFGSAMAAGGDNLLIGAPGAYDGLEEAHGAVYVFASSGSSSAPTLTRTLSALDTRKNLHFGCAIAISGDRAVIGARGADIYPAGIWASDDNGNAYVFSISSGNQLAKLFPVKGSRPVPGALAETGCFWFGFSVAFAEDIIVVGAPHARAPCAKGGVYGGAAFTFDATSYKQTNRLLASDPEREDEFGRAVAAHVRQDGRSLVLVGAPGAGVSGAIYIHGPTHVDVTPLSDESTGIASSWGARMLAPAGFGGDSRFGHAMAIDSGSGVALVAAPNAFSSSGPTTGSVSLLRSWAPAAVPNAEQQLAERMLWGPDAEPGDAFGSSAAFGPAGITIVGATQHRQESGNATGTAYIFEPRYITLSPTSPPPTPTQPLPAPLPPALPPPIHEYLTLGVALGAASVIAGLLCLVFWLLAVTLLRKRGMLGGPKVGAVQGGRRCRVGAEEDVSSTMPSASPEGLIGERVTLHDLQAHPELEGAVGMVLFYSIEKGRCLVQLDEGGRQVSVKPSKLLRKEVHTSAAYTGRPSRPATARPVASSSPRPTSGAPSRRRPTSAFGGFRTPTQTSKHAPPARTRPMSASIGTQCEPPTESDAEPNDAEPYDAAQVDSEEQTKPHSLAAEDEETAARDRELSSWRDDPAAACAAASSAMDAAGTLGDAADNDWEDGEILDDDEDGEEPSSADNYGAAQDDEDSAGGSADIVEPPISASTHVIINGLRDNPGGAAFNGMEAVVVGIADNGRLVVSLCKGRKSIAVKQANVVVVGTAAAAAAAANCFGRPLSARPQLVTPRARPKSAHAIGKGAFNLMKEHEQQRAQGGRPRSQHLEAQITPEAGGAWERWKETRLERQHGSRPSSARGERSGAMAESETGEEVGSELRGLRLSASRPSKEGTPTRPKRPGTAPMSRTSPAEHAVRGGRWPPLSLPLP